MVEELYPEAVIKSCRFHLGQQSVGLAKECKLNGSDISKRLHQNFGLAFLRPEDLNPDMPKDKRVVLSVRHI